MPSIYISVALQELVKKRANEYCEYCYCPADFSPDFFQFDHILPLSLGGRTEANNLARACGGCNNYKTNKISWFDPLTNVANPLFHPRKDLWTDHFQWNEDDTLIIGNTPVGRATIALLQMNRPALINLRELLILVDMHPPSEYPVD